MRLSAHGVEQGTEAGRRPAGRQAGRQEHPHMQASRRAGIGRTCKHGCLPRLSEGASALSRAHNLTASIRL